MEPGGSGNITVLLKAWVAGDSAAQDQLIPLVYKELRRLARYYRRKAGPQGTLQTTALVHEAYLRLVDIHNVEWNDRVHFFAVSSQLMRRIVIDRARARGAAKRGGMADPVNHLDLDNIPAPDSQRASELIALDDALTTLARMDPRRAKVIELRIFGGLSHEEIASVVDLSPQSVMRDWKLAKAWLLREMSQGTQGNG
jgi:RNA polymerase sigma factor (TIGR02999 family)